MQEKYEIMVVEKEELEKEVYRVKNLYENKLNQLEQQSSLKIDTLQKTLKLQKQQYCDTESKAFEMIKKHESLNEHLKSEFSNTINFLANQNEQLVKENSIIKKHFHMDGEIGSHN